MEGSRIADFQDLEPMVGQTFKKQLYELRSAGNLPDEIFLMLGYQMPGTNELHWLCVKLDRKRIPVKSFRVAPGSYEYRLLSGPISYCKTFDCSYSRFFGRGGLSKTICNKKILIIGVGALGSSLAKILVRAGIMNIAVSDFDRVEPGNICRSEYGLNNISELKWLALLKQLVIISPFAETGHEDIVSKILDEPYRSNDKARLEKYDIIFDCSSDMEVAYFIDQLKLETEVLNISLSNEAKELVCVAGGHRTAEEKSLIFEKLNHDESLMFYEGTGCWSPTFNASYFDINALLNFAVKKIDNVIDAGRPFNTFILKYNENQDNLTIKSIDY